MPNNRENRRKIRLRCSFTRNTNPILQTARTSAAAAATATVSSEHTSPIFYHNNNLPSADFSSNPNLYKTNSIWQTTALSHPLKSEMHDRPATSTLSTNPSASNLFSKRLNVSSSHLWSTMTKSAPDLAFAESKLRYKSRTVTETAASPSSFVDASSHFQRTLNTAANDKLPKEELPTTMVNS